MAKDPAFDPEFIELVTKELAGLSSELKTEKAGLLSFEKQRNIKSESHGDVIVQSPTNVYTITIKYKI